MWLCFVTAAVLALVLVATRWFDIDFQTGSRLDVDLDEGSAIFVAGEAPMNVGLEVTRHEPDQDAWQWWFHSYPHSVLVPIWAPMLMMGCVAYSLRPRVRVRESNDLPPG
jgi:hypothetical protein